MIHLIQHPSLVKLTSDTIHRNTPYESDITSTGEEFGYQVVIYTDQEESVPASVKLSFKGKSKIYLEKCVPVSYPHYSDDTKGCYHLDDEGMLPDCLIPLKESNCLYISNNFIVLWVSLTPAEHGEFKATLKVSTDSESATCKLNLNVIKANLCKQYLSFGQYIDPIGIANDHHVEMFGEEFWGIFQNYCSLALEHGIDDIMVPLFTPQYENYPVDRVVQLVSVRQLGSDSYDFDFSLVDRWIQIAKEVGIKQFTFPAFLPDYDHPLGARFEADVNGESKIIFENEGVQSPYYIIFIRKFLLALIRYIEKAHRGCQFTFHFSCSPQVWNAKMYEEFRGHFYDFVKIHRVADYDVEYRFYKKDLVSSAIIHMHDVPQYFEDPSIFRNVCFDISNSKDVINPLIAASSVRLRLLGMYSFRYEFCRFFHMGFNYSGTGVQTLSNSSETQKYPSGSLSLVYPADNAVYPSIRLKQIQLAIQDRRVVDTLHRRYSPKRVFGMIDKTLKLKPESYIDDVERFQKLRFEIYELLENLNKYNCEYRPIKKRSLI